MRQLVARGAASGWCNPSPTTQEPNNRPLGRRRRQVLQPQPHPQQSHLTILHPCLSRLLRLSLSGVVQRVSWVQVAQKLGEVSELRAPRKGAPRACVGKIYSSHSCGPAAKPRDDDSRGAETRACRGDDKRVCVEERPAPGKAPTPVNVGSAPAVCAWCACVCVCVCARTRGTDLLHRLLQPCVASQQVHSRSPPRLHCH